MNSQTHQNIFVVGLDPFNHRRLENLPNARECRFHPLLRYHEIRQREDYPVEELLDLCEQRLAKFKGSIDAIVGFFDFPVTILVSILAQRHGLPHTPLEAVLKCEHKYWSRLLQQEVIPEHIPRFEAFDPFDESPHAGISLLHPYWIKPIKSFRSYLAYRINDEYGFAESITLMRRGVRAISESFAETMGHIQTPQALIDLGERSCIAESLLSGSMCTLEGYCIDGEVVSYGVVDSVREADRSSFSRYEYPSQLPESVQERMHQITAKLMSHIGYHHGTFNVEFFYNQTDDSIALLEVNPRHSQSHAYLFERIHGISNHGIMLDLALGRKPELPPIQRPGERSAKFMLRTSHDAFITRVPRISELERLQKSVAGAEVEVLVKEGMRLSQLGHQDSYSYELADLYLTAQSVEQMIDRYHQCLGQLSFSMAQEAPLPIEALGGQALT